MPGENRWLRMPFPASRLLVLYLLGLVLFLPWLTRPGQPVWLVRYLVGVTLLAGLDLLAALFSPVRCRREGPATGFVGRPVTGSLWLENGGFYPVHLQAYDDVPPSMVAETLPLRIRLRPRARVRVPYRVRAYRRGRFQLQWVYLWVGGPLGLVWRPLRQRQTWTLRIDPDLTEALRAVLVWRRNPFQVGRRRLRRSGAGTEFLVLRPYTVGDDWRHIDWSATARHRRPHVRVYHQEVRQLLWIVLDASRVMGGRWRGKTRMDYAAAAAANLAWLAVSLGDRVRFLAYHHHVVWQTPWFQGPASVHTWLPALSELQVAPVEPHYPALQGVLPGPVGPRCLVVWFTAIADPRLAPELIALLEAMARRHRVVLVNLQDPAVRRLLHRTPRHRLDALATALAAQMELLQRTLDERLMRKNVVPLRPEQPGVVPKVLDVYLDVRLRGG